MKEVKMTLCNIQSHELTSLTFRPGLTLIVSDDNNVGKSTIFKILKILPVASTVNPDQLSDLLRTGAPNGYAMFEFDSMRVVLWLLRQPNGKVLPLFQTEVCGEITQTSKCPVELLEALDIVYHKPTENVLNIIEADKVQLIVDEGKESDAVISSMLIDFDVENAKQNLKRFHQTLYNDDRSFYAQYERVDEDLRELSYNSMADDYFEELPMLSRLAEILDKGKVDFSTLQVDFNLAEMQACMRLVESISNLLKCQWDYRKESTVDFDRVETLARIYEIAEKLERIDIPRAEPIPMEKIRRMSRAANVLDSIGKAYYILRESNSLDQQESLLRENYQTIRQQIMDNAEIVVCPIKGKVVFSDEECVSIGD